MIKQVRQLYLHVMMQNVKKHGLKMSTKQILTTRFELNNLNLWAKTTLVVADNAEVQVCIGIGHKRIVIMNESLQAAFAYQVLDPPHLLNLVLAI